jgi:hypothetical protein
VHQLIVIDANSDSPTVTRPRVTDFVTLSEGVKLPGWGILLVVTTNAPTASWHTMAALQDPVARKASHRVTQGAYAVLAVLPPSCILSSALHQPAH